VAKTLASLGDGGISRSHVDGRKIGADGHGRTGDGRGREAFLPRREGLLHRDAA